MTTYAFRSPTGDVIGMFPEFAPPTPLHALTASAEKARASMRRGAVERRVDRLMQNVVTTIPDAGRVVHEAVPVELDTLKRNAGVVARLALAGGFTCQAFTLGEQTVVEGYRLAPRKEGFRTTWNGTVARLATWHEPMRFEMVDDDRAVNVTETSRTARAGFRAAGVDARHLRQLSSPHGVRMSITELIARLREIAAA